MINIKDLPDEELFTPGHTACPGCGVAQAVRNLMKVLGKNTVVYLPANCLLVFSATYPLDAFKVPYLHLLFENSGVAAAGIRRALRKLGKNDVNVVALAGDGGTADIGMQALSGAAERNEDIIYVMVDNEAYMNTGIQRSGSTPFGAWTTTTPVGKKIKGKMEHKKDVMKIMMAHEVPYAATVSPAFPADMLRKFEKVKNKHGFRFLQIYTTCPTGWRAPSEKTITLARMAVETGIFPLLEYEDGVLKVNYRPKGKYTVEEYLKAQGRFKHFTPEMMEEVKHWIEMKWRWIRTIEEGQKALEQEE
ncbi:MAG: pyruvate synthase subunit beta [Thermoplasmata archaeon]|nr:pyruvate synthase subunit beta [Thermoplasmata archaeon]